MIGSLRISSSLERMGDLAVHVAKQARLRYPNSSIPTELRASFAQLEMRIALRAILSALEVTSALPGREGTGRRSITLSPRRGTPISVRPRVSAPQIAVGA